MKIPFFIIWKWQTPTFRTVYESEHVNQLCLQMRKHGVPDDRIILITDDPKGVQECRTFPLWSDMGGVPNASGPHLPSCYRRLKIFSPKVQAELGIEPGERIVSFDLDAVIVQKFMDLFDRNEDFVGWHVPGTRHAWVLNGSMFMFTAGKLGWLWDQFDSHKSPGQANRSGFMGSDQGYLSYNLIGRTFVGQWTAESHGVMSYMRDINRPRLLPKHTRIVFFPGPRKPWQPDVQRQQPWIKRYLVEKTSPSVNELKEEARV